VNPAGVLLDTGPLVALLSQNDANHERARKLFADCLPPFRCCEAVVAEACFLMRRVHADGPAEVVALGVRGVYEVAISAAEHWTNIEALLRKYSNRPISFADACLIRCAEIHEEARILTFDRDFTIYKWARNRKFDLLESQ
jgi:predicted nucleic acid-binding protein